MQRGLHVVRYASSGVGRDFPIATVVPADGFESLIQIISSPGTREGWLDRPGSAVVLRVQGAAKVEIGLRRSSPTGSLDASFQVDALTNESSPSPRPGETPAAAIAESRDTLVRPEDPVAGNPKGDVTIVEFFDTRCPYCRKMEPVMTQFLGQDRNVRLVYKDLPILGPASTLGSKALLAAQKQGAYEKMRDAVMKLPSETTLPIIQAEAKRLGLDPVRLAHDMEEPSVQQRLDDNLKLAHVLGIQGTPALVIGGDLIPGALDLPELQKVVAEARKGG